MPVNKTLAALEKVVAALEPLDPEERRRVLEATHTLLEISCGESGEQCGQDMPYNGFNPEARQNPSKPQRASGRGAKNRRR